MNAELKMRDFELYGGYYCGICKSIGRRYGQMPRLVLSYDAVFLAMVLAAASGEDVALTREHCVTHHIRKKTIAACDAVDYAADVMLMLAWYKLDDDIRDEGKIHSRAAAILNKRYFKMIRARRPELEKHIREGLLELELFEKRRGASLDQAGAIFGRVMEAMVTGYFQTEMAVCEKETGEPAVRTISAGQMAVLKQMVYHLGRWIYLMDAWDDIEDDIKSGAYNPLKYRFSLQSGESAEAFRQRIKEDVERNLMMYLEQLGNAVDLLEMKGNKDIIENIVYLGLRRRTDLILGNIKEAKDQPKEKRLKLKKRKKTGQRNDESI